VCVFRYVLTPYSKGGGIRRIHDDVSRWASVAWHSDVSFENVPADYSMLKINVLPESGGDTMWASTSDVSHFSGPCEIRLRRLTWQVLDKMSPSFRAYLENLTATHDASFFHAEAAQHGIKIDKERTRGNPLNTGDHLTASHPLIRTNRESASPDFSLHLTI
jgi:alpha-ketoglutarate-dependent taurine dioxygenase